jgi:hypothetical protein
MCTIQTRLTRQHAAADVAYRAVLARMKEIRGEEFERAWRLLEQRRTSLMRTHHVLQEHEKEHQCAPQNPSQPSRGSARLQGCRVDIRVDVSH